MVHEIFASKVARNNIVSIMGVLRYNVLEQLIKLIKCLIIIYYLLFKLLFSYYISWQNSPLMFDLAWQLFIDVSRLFDSFEPTSVKGATQIHCGCIWITLKLLLKYIILYIRIILMVRD